VSFGGFCVARKKDARKAQGEAKEKPWGCITRNAPSRHPFSQGYVKYKRQVKSTTVVASRRSSSQKSKINFSPLCSSTYELSRPAHRTNLQHRLLPCNREPERTHDVSGRCPLSSRDHGGHSLKQWAAGAPVIGAAPVSSGKPKRPRVEGLPASGALQLKLLSHSNERNEKRNLPDLTSLLPYHRLTDLTGECRLELRHIGYDAIDPVFIR
jgi:hypothetical protein